MDRLSDKKNGLYISSCHSLNKFSIIVKLSPDAGSVSIKDKQAKLAGLFGGATQTTAPPLQPAPPVSRAISPPARPVPGILPPKIPPARPGADLPPPPPPLSCKYFFSFQ